MNWHPGESDEDQEFETFLRQFRPPAPPAFPARRMTVTKAAVAAGLVLAAIIPLRSLWTGPGAGDASSSKPSNVAPPAATSMQPSNSAQGPTRQTPLEASGQNPQAPQAPQAPVQSGPLRADGVNILPPKRIFNVNPEYPENAQAAQVEGVVVLQILIGKDGSVTVERVLRSVPMLDDAAIEAASQWEYEPTLLNGKPVEIQMNVLLNFTLQ